MNKKGQAAMEFLMTYGWAILVVLIAIGALAYFGVLNPGKYLPNSCTISNQIGCSEFKAAAGGTAITLVLQNGRGTDINFSQGGWVATAINITSPSAFNCPANQSTGSTNLGAGPAQNPGVNFVDGATMTVIFNCGSALPAAGGKVKGNINLQYADASSSLGVRYATGSITTKTE
jgi:hypothetical protein